MAADAAGWADGDGMVPIVWLTSRASNRGEGIADGIGASPPVSYSSRASSRATLVDEAAPRRNRSNLAQRNSRKSYSAASWPTGWYSLLIWSVKSQVVFNNDALPQKSIEVRLDKKLGTVTSEKSMYGFNVLRAVSAGQLEPLVRLTSCLTNSDRLAMLRITARR